MHADWTIPVLATQAHKNVGIAELYTTIAAHRQTLETSGQLAARRRAHRRKELLELLQQRLLMTLIAQLEKDTVLLELVEQVEAGGLDPYSAAQQILGEREALWR